MQSEPGGRSTTVGIIGAGPAGLMAARVLRERGLRVTLFDKGRRPGGRVNTREHGARRFDHGAPYFTVRSDRIRPYLAAWLEAGVVAEWTGRLVRIDGDAVEPARPATRYVGVPGNIALASHLADGLDVRPGRRVEAVARDGDRWAFAGADGTLGRYDAAIVAVPAPQAAPLLDAVPALRERAAVEMTPCWAGMYAFPAPLDLDFDGAFLVDGPLSWVARNSSKPGRPPEETWVLHAGPEWSARPRGPDEAAAGMLEAFRRRFGPVPEPTFARAHRWAYARPPAPLGEVLWDPARRIGACGDWCRGGRVEGALLSGIALAEAMAG